MIPDRSGAPAGSSMTIRAKRGITGPDEASYAISLDAMPTYEKPRWNEGFAVATDCHKTTIGLRHLEASYSHKQAEG